jgi:hypothetical protein
MRQPISVFVLLVIIAVPDLVFGSEKHEKARHHDQAPPAATDPAEAVGSSAKGDKNLDFNFFPAEGEAGSTDAATSNQEADEVARKASTRRWMLKTHQTLGLITWALMAATVTVGQLNYNQLYGGGGGSTKWQGTHAALVFGTSLTFAGTGAFAIFAPQPYKKPLKLDTGLVHRIAVAGATLGMLTEVVLGIATKSRANAGNPRELRTLARTHQIIGYSTFGLLTAAATVWVF